MKAAAFSPAHITGFFAVKTNPDPLKAGSIGCGFCLEAGVRASIKVDKYCEGPVINLNGAQTDFPTVRYVIEKMTGSDSGVVVDLASDIQPGFGFGVSGAAALAAAYALIPTLGLEVTANRAAEIAHTAEVVNKTGMGDVAGQCTGGAVIRIAPGAPGTGKVQRMPVDPIEISWICLGEISTASVLGDKSIIERINKSGERALKALLKRPGFHHFMSLSKQFAIETGLMSDRARDVVEAVEASGGAASMAMLGDTVFATGGTGALSEFGPVGRSRISLQGAQYI